MCVRERQTDRQTQGQRRERRKKLANSNSLLSLGNQGHSFDQRFLKIQRVYRAPFNAHKAEVYIQLIAFPSHASFQSEKVFWSKGRAVADKTKLYRVSCCLMHSSLSNISWLFTWVLISKQAYWSLLNDPDSVCCSEMFDWDCPVLTTLQPNGIPFLLLSGFPLSCH